MLLLSRLTNEQSWPLFVVRWVIFGLLLSASWYVHPLFSLFCFVPYFVTMFRHKANAAWYLQLFILNLTWNAAITFWLCRLDIIRGSGALLANSALFLLPVLMWRLYIRYGRIRQAKAFSLLLWWLLFEYAHHLWDFSWTWLTVGNVFGKAPQLVLWYSWLGVMGGSAWILICNYLIYQLSKQTPECRIVYRLLTVILLPIVLSAGLWFLRKEDPAEPQKNITAIATTLSGEDEISDMEKMRIVDSLATLDKKPKGITLLPEVLLTNDVWINRFSFGNVYPRLKQALQLWHTNNIIVGALLNVPDVDGLHVEKHMSLQQRYSRYNAAMMIDASDTLSLKLKKVYVPVAEYVPGYLSFLHLKTYGLAKDLHNTNHFEIDNRQYFIGICYEVVNSIFVTQSLKENTSAILMLSSESFFGDSETGRRQYMNICRLRAVENNLPLVKTSNEGIVMAVSAKGGLLQAKRTFHPFVMHTAIRLSTPSCYHIVATYLPYFLMSSLALLLLLPGHCYIASRIRPVPSAGG
jgi:apolipoprotein N-acyltransferase